MTVLFLDWVRPLFADVSSMPIPVGIFQQTVCLTCSFVGRETLVYVSFSVLFYSLDFVLF